MPAKLQELVGEFDWERAVFPQDCCDMDPDRTIIGSLMDGKTVKGKAAGGALERGMTYRFSGRWVKHDRYGDQFHFDAFVKSTPASHRGVVKYLSKCRGVGSSIANTLWRTYGPDAVRKLREEPEAVAERMHQVMSKGGFTVEKARAASEDLTRWAALEQVTIDVTDLLASRGFPRALPSLVIGEWGAAAAERIRENPFLLMRWPGVGFLKADALYRELGLPLHAMVRQGYAAAYSVGQDRSGSTWVPKEMAARGLRSCVGGIADVDEAFAWAIEHDLLRERTDDAGKEWIALAENAEAETALAGLLHEAELEIQGPLGLRDPSKLGWPDPDSISGLSDHQRSQLKLALRGRVCILSGGPGTGKTHTLARLLAACEKHGMGQVSLVAPTGKAAVRMTEALIESGYSVGPDDRGRTIASLLCGDEPLRPVGVADESSMDDTSLTALLLGRRGRDAHLIFVGDVHQLPPVGHGAPLRDMMAAGIPYGELSVPHRNAGRIVLACKEIREKHTITPSLRIDLHAESPENLWIDPCNTPSQQLESLRQWLTDTSKIRDVWPGYDGNAAWSCQVIVPLNEKSEISRKVLNGVLQNELNPLGTPVQGTAFRISDKIINTTNNWLTAGPGCPLDQVIPGRGVYVANGEQGMVVESSPKSVIVKLSTPDRIVRVPIGKDGGVGDWELGYAISCHRAQGSAWDFVFVMLDEAGGAKMLCDRHWLLTGISRARKLCVMPGKLVTARRMCRNSNMWSRKTFLVEKLEQLRDFTPDDPRGVQHAAQA